MNQYKNLFSLEKNLYINGAPVLLEAGVLFVNLESGRLHVQLKFKNLSNVAIPMVKVCLVLMDAIGREVGRNEKQYIDLNAQPNQSFGNNEAIYLNDNTVREFSVIIEEICFANGSIWTPPQNALLEKIPSAKPIDATFREKETLDEFKRIYCKHANFTPFSYKDLWVCACGNVNKSEKEKCCSCGAKLADMLSADNETLKKNIIYRNANALISKSISSEIQKGIDLFETIIDWKDSKQKLETAKQKIVDVQQAKKEKHERKSKRRKKNIFIAALSCAVAVVLIVGICIGNSVSKSNKYKQAQSFMAENNVSSYAVAMYILDDLKGYKDADKLHKRAECMSNGNYKTIVDTDKLTEFIIPEGTTKIADNAFYGCRSLTSVTLPNSVTSIGSDAFSNCYGLTSITIPDSVNSIGSDAFYACSKLTSVFFQGTATEWAKISIADDNWNLKSATKYYYSETKPTTSGNYWHYVNGIPAIWTSTKK